MENPHVLGTVASILMKEISELLFAFSLSPVCYVWFLCRRNKERAATGAFEVALSENTKLTSLISHDSSCLKLDFTLIFSRTALFLWIVCWFYRRLMCSLLLWCVYWSGPMAWQYSITCGSIFSLLPFENIWRFTWKKFKEYLQALF